MNVDCQWNNLQCHSNAMPIVHINILYNNFFLFFLRVSQAHKSEGPFAANFEYVPYSFIHVITLSFYIYNKYINGCFLYSILILSLLFFFSHLVHSVGFKHIYTQFNSQFWSFFWRERIFIFWMHRFMLVCVLLRCCAVVWLLYVSVFLLLHINFALLLATINPNRLLFYHSTLDGFVRNNAEKLALTL